jgi:hypothetical protein
MTPILYTKSVFVKKKNHKHDTTAAMAADQKLPVMVYDERNQRDDSMTANRSKNIFF